MIRRILNGTAALALLASGACAAAPLDLQPRWQAGTQVQFVLTKTHDETEGDHLTSHASTATPVTIDVLEANAAGYVIRWRYGTSTYEPARPVGGLDFDGGLLQARDVTLQLDPLGQVQKVLNWEQVRDRSDALLVHADEVVHGAQRDAASEMSLQLMRSRMRQSLSTEARVRALCTSEARMLLFVRGRHVDAPGPADEAAAIAELFGNTTLDAIPRITLDDARPAGGPVTIAVHREADGEDVDKALIEMMDQLGDPSGPPHPPATDMHQTFLEDAVLVVDAGRDWPRDVTVRRTNRYSSPDRVLQTVESTQLVRR